ncbi:MAG: metal-dependent hydrolase [Myxococcota bacterium]
MTAQPTEAPTLRPRKMDFPFTDAIPRYWVVGSPLLTHMVNGLNLLFPKGERFFIRSVRTYMNEVRDPELREQVRGFMAQEVRHGMEHERFFEILKSQGYDIDRFLEWYDRLAYQMIEPRFSPAARLSVTTALEHYTAMFGELALTDELPFAHPELRELLLWHAAEEIEHKSVCFDVLQEVDPRYSVRVVGLMLATAGLLAFWAMATADLMRQDRAMGIKPPKRSPEAGGGRFAGLRDAYTAFWERPTFRGMARGFVDFLRPGFHPDQHDNYALAEAYLRRIGRLEG